MGKLGVSLYPEKTDFMADKVYLEQAKKYGFTRIFMNLLLFKQKDVSKIVTRLKQSITYGNKLGFESYIDVNPYTLKALNLESTDLKYFHDMGVKGIRLDMGFTGKEEANMTRNPYGLKIEINMSNDDNYLNRIFDYNPNRENLVGCHNFFPQAYTGLSIDYFKKCSDPFFKRHLKSAAFVTSQTGEIGPWSLHEGLCTIEDHRHLPIEKQVKHIKSLQIIDDIIIGNAYASEEELEKMSHAFFDEKFELSVNLNENCSDLEREIIEENIHSYRGDRSKFMIRSSMSRLTYLEKSIPVNNENNPIKEGDVLILNDDYAQYKGEVQIALCDRPADPRINTVGSIEKDELLLLKTLKPYTDFELSSKQKK